MRGMGGVQDREVGSEQYSTFAIGWCAAILETPPQAPEKPSTGKLFRGVDELGEGERAGLGDRRGVCDSRVAIARAEGQLAGYLTRTGSLSSE